MPLKHLTYTATGRKFNVVDKDDKPTGDKVSKFGCGQVNVLDGKDYKPYLWDSDHQICKFNKYEIRLVTGGVEVWEGNTKLVGFGAHPEIEDEAYPGDFDRKTATVSGLATSLATNNDSADRIEISYDVDTDDFKAKVSFEVGGARGITFGVVNTAKVLDKKQRTTLEFDQESTLQKAVLGDLNRKKYLFKDKKSFWTWDPSENDDHTVTLETDKTKFHLKEKVYDTLVSEILKPDTWGPTNVGDAGFELGDTTWYDDSGGDILVGNYSGSSLDAAWTWTVTDTDLPGATINTGTRLTIPTYTQFSGTADGLLRICDSRDVGTWGSSNRPSGETKHPDTVEWDRNSNGSPAYSPEAQALVQARIDGDDTAGAHQSGDKMSFVWEDVNSATGDQGYWAEETTDLTIEYTPASGGGISIPVVMNQMNQF